MTERDYIKEKLAVVKMIMTVIFGAMIGLVVYYIISMGVNFWNVMAAVIILGVFLVYFGVRPYKKLLDRLLVESTTLENKEESTVQSESTNKNIYDFKKDFLNAAKIRDNNFFDNIKADDLRIAKKLAEIEISKKEFEFSKSFVYYGIILALLGIGLSEILFILPTFIDLNQWQRWYLFGGILIIVLGFILPYIFEKIINKERLYVDFLYDRILEIEKRLPYK